MYKTFFLNSRFSVLTFNRRSESEDSKFIFTTEFRSFYVIFKIETGSIKQCWNNTLQFKIPKFKEHTVTHDEFTAPDNNFPQSSSNTSVCQIVFAFSHVSFSSYPLCIELMPSVPSGCSSCRFQLKTHISCTHPRLI